MPRLTAILFISLLLISCHGSKNAPDVSGIPITMHVSRFEQDMFQIDTLNIPAALEQLHRKYPEFLSIFLQYELGLTRETPASEQLQLIQQYLRQYRPLYDSVRRKYPDFNKPAQEIEQSFKYIKYYYPAYKTPNLVTLVGPLNQLAKLNDQYTPDFLGKTFAGISLQFYLGKDFSIYHDKDYIANVVPEFRSRRFDREYIAADIVNLLADDIHPDSSGSRPLIEQIIEKGKRWYLIDHFMPETPDSIKTGYTQKQLQWCSQNEGNIWGFITRNTDLFTVDPETIQTFIGEAPFTQGMPETSPGNIGQWAGWQIVKKYAADHASLSLQQVLATPPNIIFQEARYKPK